MPPAPTGATISKAPSFFPAASATGLPQTFHQVELREPLPSGEGPRASVRRDANDDDIHGILYREFLPQTPLTGLDVVKPHSRRPLPESPDVHGPRIRGPLR